MSSQTFKDAGEEYSSIRISWCKEPTMSSTHGIRRGTKDKRSLPSRASSLDGETESQQLQRSQIDAMTRRVCRELWKHRARTPRAEREGQSGLPGGSGI